MSNLTEPEIKILDAAKKVFESFGYGGARMQQIADEAGISKASLHYYFRSKEKLFDHIFDETMAEFLPIISTWGEEDSEDWEKKIRSFIKNLYSFFRTKSLLFILREINRNPELLYAKKKGKDKKNRFIPYFEKLRDAGKIKDIDIRFVYILLHSMCAYPVINGTLFKMTLNTTDKEFDHMMEDYPDFVADFLIQGIKKNKK